MKQNILDKLANGVVLGDGGYLLELERRGHVRPGPFTPEVCIQNPDAVKQLHYEFLNAGAEVLQALTFYATAEKMDTVGLKGKTDDINRAAVRIAKEAAGDMALVAGTLSLTWLYEQGSATAEKKVRTAFDQQVQLQSEEGVDFFIGETFSWLGEALIALDCAKQSKLPAMITVCFEKEALSNDGKTPEECAKILQDNGADIVGVNCLWNPEQMLPVMKRIRKAVTGYIACQPVAYQTPPGKNDFTSLPEFPYALESICLSRGAMGEYARQAREIGVNYIGSCCGSAACHVREMAKALGKNIPGPRTQWKFNPNKPMSGFEYYYKERGVEQQS